MEQERRDLTRENYNYHIMQISATHTNNYKSHTRMAFHKEEAAYRIRSKIRLINTYNDSMCYFFNKI